MFFNHVKFIAQNKLVDIIICIVPKSFENKIVIQTQTEEDIEDRIDTEEKPELEINFRRALKGKTMFLGKPLQLVREYSLTSSSRGQDATQLRRGIFAQHFITKQCKPFLGN